jgi:predicted Zn-dependent protease with MMP-like domain
MTVEECKAIAADVLGELPQKVHDALERVTLHVLDAPPEGEPADARGAFVGQQAAEDDLGEEDGAFFDVDTDTGDLFQATDMGSCIAAGDVFLFASNLKSADDVERALYHEIAHALGEDENDAALLGVG